jgi:hypothetical protein
MTYLQFLRGHVRDIQDDKTGLLLNVQAKENPFVIEAPLSRVVNNVSPEALARRDEGVIGEECQVLARIQVVNARPRSEELRLRFAAIAAAGDD